jgi:hypothetical protein
LLAFAFAFALLLPGSSSAKTYSNQELRKEGFTGNYRGTMRGTLYE